MYIFRFLTLSLMSLIKFSIPFNWFTFSGITMKLNPNFKFLLLNNNDSYFDPHSQYNFFALILLVLIKKENSCGKKWT